MFNGFARKFIRLIGKPIFIKKTIVGAIIKANACPFSNINDLKTGD
jgi:hypothetical protein